MRCTTCRVDLVTLNYEGLVSFLCPECRGAAVTVAVLRRLVPKERFNALWQAVRSSTTRGGPNCPTCRKSMRVVTASVEGHAAVTLDGCANCQLIWFDVEELERFSPEGLAPREVERPRKPSEPAESLVHLLGTRRPYGYSALGGASQLGGGSPTEYGVAHCAIDGLLTVLTLALFD